MRFALLLLAVLAGTSQADDARLQQMRAAAEALASNAKLAGDPAMFAACGQAYLDLYNADTKAPDAYEALYNAGVCFDEARSVGAAITAFEQLGRVFPKSKLQSRAVARRAGLYQRIGQLAKAADLYEEYNRHYTGEKDALDALSTATFLRRALGDDEKVIANTHLFIKLYGVKRKQEAAQAMFGLGPIYARKSATAYVTHLREFIRVVQDPELTASAYAGIGESLWKSACATPDVDGLCVRNVRIGRDRTLPIAPRKHKAVAGQKRCGPANVSTVVPIARDAKLVAEAERAWSDAEKAFGRVTTSAGSSVSTHARARVKLLLADRALENYLAVRFPTGLDFSPNSPKRAASLTRFNDFIQQRQRLGTLAQSHYEAIIRAQKDSPTAIAALQRLGFVSHAFGLDLMAAEVPIDVRSGEFAVDKIDAFCDKMTEVAEPLIKKAIDGYDQCLAKASQLGIDDTSVRVCARERASLGPTTFALSLEMLPELPVALPVVEEPPVRPIASQPQAFRDALAKLWKLHAKPIPQAQCKTLLRDVETAAKQHRLADIEATVGFLLGRCGPAEQARAAYTRALQLDPRHAIAMSNLGELEYRAGNRDAAGKQWTDAVAANPKLFGARVGLATLALGTLRALPPKAANRVQLENDIELQATSAAAVGDDHVAPYVQLAILAMTKAQPAIARYYVDLARRLDPSPYTELAHAALVAKTGAGMLAILDAAAAAPLQLDETHLARGVHFLALRRYDDAIASLAKVKTASYDIAIARGVAARGQAKYAEAEKHYSAAIALDASRPHAHFNLGVLWKDYTAARAPNAATAKAAFKKAADSFRRAGTPDAKAFADDCDKAIVALP